MHELALSEEILEILTLSSRKEGVRRIIKVTLEVGRLSGVEPDALRFCLDLVFRGTVAEGAQVMIEEPLGEGWCFYCNRSTVLSGIGASCTHCGGGPVQQTRGSEFRILDMDVV